MRSLKRLPWDVNVALATENRPYEYRKVNGDLVARPLFVREENETIEYYRFKLSQNDARVLVIRKFDREILYHSEIGCSEFVVLGHDCFAVMTRRGDQVTVRGTRVVSVVNPEVVVPVSVSNLRCNSPWMPCSAPYIRNNVLWMNGRFFQFKDGKVEEISGSEVEKLNFEDDNTGWNLANLAD